MVTTSQAEEGAVIQSGEPLKAALADVFKDQSGVNRRKRGRPRNTVELARMSLVKQIVEQASYVAMSRGVNINLYLSDILAPRVAEDFAEELIKRPGMLYSLFGDAIDRAALDRYRTHRVKASD